jgi:hypothetical protein
VTNHQEPDLEDRLRAAFQRAPQPELPDAIRHRIDSLSSEEQSAPPRRAVLWPLRFVAAATGIAVLTLVALQAVPRGGRPNGHGGIASTSVASPDPIRESSTPSSLVSVPVQDWAGSFVPVALAIGDTSSILLVGGTGDSTGQGVIANMTADGILQSVRKIDGPELESISAAGSTMLAVTGCPADAPLDCRGGLIASHDAGDTFGDVAVSGLVQIALVDQTTGWAVGALDLRSSSSIWTTRDAGESWEARPVPCDSSLPGAAAIDFVSDRAGWLVCVGDSGGGSQAKQLLGTVDGGTTWKVLAAQSLADGARNTGVLPLPGQVRGLSFLPDGHGWLSTDRGLLASADGGRTWTPIVQDVDGSLYPTSAILIGEDSGLALMRDGNHAQVVLQRTEDGGRNWVALRSWPLAP